MLILSRRPEEEIVIFPGTPQEVRVKVIEIRPGKVRLGVEADKSIPVHRAEVWEAIKQGG